MTLDKLDIDKYAVIMNLNCKGDLRRRLLDLGLVHGTNIQALFKSPIGNPIAYEVRGTTIALRKEDSRFINICCKDDSRDCPSFVPKGQKGTVLNRQSL